MFLYEKKIVYLTFFWDGVKKSSAGFIKVSRERDACKLDIHIRRIDGPVDGKYTLYLALRDRETEWGSVTIKSGAVNEEKSIPICRGKFRLGEKEIEEEELCGILIRLGREQWISGYWQEGTKTAKLNDLHAADECSVEKEIPEKYEEEKSIPKKYVPEEVSEDHLKGYMKEHMAESSFPDKGQIQPEPTLGSKWEQLQSVYRKVHPFGDERLYLSIEPRDFIIFQAPYQRLVNNSFLLHGYYNYRHLILGPDEEIGTGNRICFYLGVPGTYFEREKMVAVMFGFEGFECAGAVEIGKFGYYMRRVEL